MKYLILITICLSGLSLNAQGFTKEYDANCDCEVVKNHFDNGQLSAEYKQTMDGKRIGVEKQYYQDGQLQYERNWVNGILDGENKNYHRNGKLYYNEQYSNGNKAGTWSFYDDEGDKVYDIAYTGNGNDATYSYFSAGVLYLKQVVAGGAMVNEQVLNQEIYDAKIEEAEAAKNAKK